MEKLITENEEKAGEIYFIDKGIQLPFFLSYWQHKHIIRQQGKQTSIIDDIRFRTPFFLFDFLLFPVLYGQFLYRKPVYKKYFRS
jgi:ligand-binding SRPBCC domain-containing protein